MKWISTWWTVALVFALSALSATDVAAETKARCGQGFLEIVDGYPVVHLKGNPYEMGYQHGTLLKEHIRENFHYLVEVKGKEKLKLFGYELMTAGDAGRTIRAHER